MTSRFWLNTCRGPIESVESSRNIANMPKWLECEEEKRIFGAVTRTGDQHRQNTHGYWYRGGGGGGRGNKLTVKDTHSKQVPEKLASFLQNNALSNTKNHPFQVYTVNPCSH